MTERPIDPEGHAYLDATLLEATPSRAIALEMTRIGSY